MGGGCELALAFDMVAGREHAAFRLPEASVGLVPGFCISGGRPVGCRAATAK